MTKEKLENTLRKEMPWITIVFAIAAILLTWISHASIRTYTKDFVLPMGFLILTYLFLIKKLQLEENPKAYGYLIPILLLLGSNFFIQVDEKNQFLNGIVLPFLTSMFFLSLTNQHYKIETSFSAFFQIFPNRLLKNLDYLPYLYKDKKKWKNKKLESIGKGILIGIPTAIVLLILLASGDKYFGALLTKIQESFGVLCNLSFYFRNLPLFSLFFILFYSTFINIRFQKESHYEQKEKKEIQTTYISTILTIVNAVFILFLISELSKLTTNFLQLPMEYTYSQYAREGFFQLLIVTSINIGLLVYFFYFSKIKEEQGPWKKLSILLILFSILLIMNSYYRMGLYIVHYGWTVLRLQVVLFLTMEILLFLYIFKKIQKKESKKEIWIYFLTMIITYILNVYVCNEPFIHWINKSFL